MESVRPSTPFAALRYRSLQKQLLKIRASWPEGVRREKQRLKLSRKSLLSLKWWVSPSGFAANSVCSIREPEPTLEILSDANMTMGGAYNSRGQFYQRHWTDQELNLDPHINLLEIRAAREAVASLASPGDRVRLHVDNVTA